MTARKKGVNPVWYIDITPGHNWLMNTISSRRRFRTSRLAKLTPFIEQMGTGVTYRKEFWWEREWRHNGDFSFSLTDVVLGFAPAESVDDLELFTNKLGRQILFVDPTWSLERIIAHLCRCRQPLSPFD